MIYIIIPVYNRWHFTKECILSLQNQSYPYYKVVLVDHGSTDGTSENVEKNFPEVVVIKGNDTMWWAEATNLGISYAIKNELDYILTLNNDLVIDENYLFSLIEISKQYPNSIIGSVSVDINNRDVIAFAGTKWNKYTAKYYKPTFNGESVSALRKKKSYIESDLLPGRGTLIPIDIFKKTGFFDSLSFPQYMADEDFSLRARRLGYSLIISTNSIVYSHILETGVNDILKKNNKFLYLKKTFTSIKSPNKLSIRWKWSRNGKIPILYFFLDCTRIIISQIKFLYFK